MSVKRRKPGGAAVARLARSRPGLASSRPGPLDVGSLRAEMQRVLDGLTGRQRAAVDVAAGVRHWEGPVTFWGRSYYLIPKNGGGYACVPARPGSAR